MAEYNLIKYLTGKLSYEDAKHWRRPPATEEEFREDMNRQKVKLESAIFAKIVERAEAGDVAAGGWLEERGLIDLPKREADLGPPPVIQLVPAKRPDKK